MTSCDLVSTFGIQVYHSYRTYLYIHTIMSDTVELKKTVPVVAAEEKVPEKGLTEDSFVLQNLNHKWICG